MPRLHSLLLSILLLSGSALGQDVLDFREAHANPVEGEKVDVRGGVVPDKPVELWVETGRPAEGVELRLVWSTDGFQSSKTATLSRYHDSAGPQGNATIWRAELPAQPNGTTLEYFYEAVRGGARTGFNGQGINGNAGENFVLNVWGGARAPAPVAPGGIAAVELERLRSSQGWLMRSRGYYSETEMFEGKPRIPIVYWNNWVEHPHWVLANDGNHRTFDAVRQGKTTIKAMVVDKPWHAFPARHAFLDSPVYADEDLERRSPIGKARDFTGVNGEADRFATVRRGAAGPAAESNVSRATAGEVFAAVRRGALERLDERRARGESLETLKPAARTVAALRLEVVKTNDVLAERAGSTVRVSTGLLNALHAQARSPAALARTLGLVLAHEAAHASGIKAERIADAEGVRILELAAGVGRGAKAVPLTKAELRAAVEAFTRPTGASRVDASLARVKDLLRHGTASARLARLEALAEGRWVDELARYRRADGTLRWKALAADRALTEGGHLAKFGLALFLKELAVVARSGDRARIEEFFEGLLTTDFYKHYGLFVIGARAGEVAYVRYLERFVRPSFVSGVLKSRLTLATGLALPQLVDGTFEGKAFAITLTSLGLSSAAVSAGARAIKWVTNLKRAEQTGTLARAGVKASRLARFGGWFYQAAELAVVLYVAEGIERRIHTHLEQKKAREALTAAARTFYAQVGRATTRAQVEAAGEGLHAAAISYRDFLYAPLLAQEAAFAERLGELAQKAKLAADRRKAALERVARQPNLSKRLVARYGSLEAYAASLAARDEAEVARDLKAAAASFEAAQDAHLATIYAERRRGTPLLAEVAHLDWLASGAPVGGAGDPTAGRTDPFARLTRWRVERALTGAIGRASLNRLEAYDDEAALIAAAAASLRRRGKPALAAALAPLTARVREAQRLDRALSKSESGPIEVKPGLAGALARPR